MRHQKQSGVLNKQNRYTYQYLIEITNNKKSEEEPVLWDQIPISGHEKIQVKLIEPQIQENSKVIKKNEFDYIEWYFKLIPGQKIKVPPHFSIEYPQEMRVNGL